MAGILPFERDHGAECYESGWEFSKDCPERCTLRKEKRVRELEQVARVMYSALIYCSNGCSEGCPMLDDGCIVSSGELQSRLEVLGVSVDD